MKTVIIDESRKQEWDRFVTENTRTIAWQSYDWSSVLKRHYNFDFFPIAAFNGQDVCGILPLYHLKTGRAGSMLMSVPYAVAGGISAEKESVRQSLLEKAISLSEELGSCPITLKQYKYKVEGDLTVDANYYNRELQLSCDIAAIWNGIAPENKEKIAKTAHEDLVLEHPVRNVADFYTTLLKHLHAKGIPCVRRRWLEDLLEFNMYSIAALRKNGVIVAATMIKEFKQTVSFPFTCKPLPANDAYVYKLYWELISHFARSGKEIFHSGRMSDSGQTDAYRLGWGGDKHDYFYQYYPLTERNTESTSRRGRKRDLFEKCWKMMPTRLARALGPSIVRQFP